MANTRTLERYYTENTSIEIDSLDPTSSKKPRKAVQSLIDNIVENDMKKMRAAERLRKKLESRRAVPK